jgi:hypothetical protein
MKPPEMPLPDGIKTPRYQPIVSENTCHHLPTRFRTTCRADPRGSRRTRVSYSICIQHFTSSPHPTVLRPFPRLESEISERKGFSSTRHRADRASTRLNLRRHAETNGNPEKSRAFRIWTSGKGSMLPHQSRVGPTVSFWSVRRPNRAITLSWGSLGVHVPVALIVVGAVHARLVSGIEDDSHNILTLQLLARPQRNF